MKQSSYQLSNTLLESCFSLDNIDVVFYYGSMFFKNIPAIKTPTPAHEHAWYEFHCVKKGRLKVRLDENATNEKTYYIKANEALFLPPRTYHITGVAEDDTQYFSLGFELACNRKNTAEQLFQSMKFAFSTDKCIKLTKCRKLAETCMELLRYTNEGGTPDCCRIHNILTTFLFQLFDRLQEVNTTEQLLPQASAEDFPDLRNYLLDYLSGNQINSITLDELSQKIFLSKKHINRIMKKRYNMTFKQKQIRFRIENAKKHLIETKLPVDQIALLVGYTNLTSFYKAFRRIVGITPKAYREQTAAKAHSKAEKTQH